MYIFSIKSGKNTIFRNNIYIMKRGIKKVKVGFSVDIETYNEFELYCNDNYINKSKLIDKIIKDFLNKEKIENKDVEIR
jgi:hypothetical protein